MENGMEALIERLKRHEGLTLAPKKDSKYWVIGYGHQIRRWVRPHMRITKEQASDLLIQDVYDASDRFLRWKRQHCPKLNMIRSEVVVELIFWIGYGGVLKFKKMTRAMEGGDYRLAALELYNSQLGKQYSMRARELAVLMWEGEDVENA